MAGLTLMDTAATAGGPKTLTDLYSLINGTSTTTTGGTQTVSGSFSPEAMNAMLTSIMGGSQGLAKVSSGVRAAGGYSGSTNTLLTNDLMTRAAGEIAKLNTAQTTSLPNPTKTVGGVTAGGIGNIATSFLAGKALNSGYDAAKKALPGLFGIQGAGMVPSEAQSAVNDSLGSDFWSSMGIGGDSGGAATMSDAIGGAFGASASEMAGGIGAAGAEGAILDSTATAAGADAIAFGGAAAAGTDALAAAGGADALAGLGDILGSLAFFA